MSAKEWILRYSKCQKKIAAYKVKIQALDDLATGITLDPSQEKIDHTKNPDMIGDLVAKMVDLENLMQEHVIESNYLYLEIQSKLLALPEQEAVLLDVRYLVGRPWSDVADLLELTPRQTLSLHYKALADLEKII